MQGQLSSILETSIRLITLIEQAGRLREWITLPLPTDVREELLQEQQRVAREITDLAVKFHRSGGRFVLTPPTVELDLPALPQTFATVLYDPPPRVELPTPITDPLEPVRAKARAILCQVLFPVNLAWEHAEILRVLGEHRESWGELTPPLMQAIVAFLTARARTLQFALEDGEQRAPAILQLLNHLQQIHQPGYVYGLSGKQRRPSNGGAWKDAARDHWHELAALLHPLPNPGGKVIDRIGACLTPLRTGVGNKTDAIARLVQEVRAAIRGGLIPTHPELVTLLTPHFGDLPAELLNLVRH